MNTYSFLKSGNWRHVQRADNRHDRIEVTQIETLASSHYPLLDHSSSVLALGALQAIKSLLSTIHNYLRIKSTQDIRKYYL